METSGSDNLSRGLQLKLVERLEYIYWRADQLTAQDPFSFNSQSERELNQLMSQTELGLDWVRQRDNERYAQQEEEAARLRADPRAQAALARSIKEDDEAAARSLILLSRNLQNAREQFERDRARRQTGEA